MFFNDYKDEFKIINKTTEELQTFLEEQGINLPLTDSSSNYCAYGIYDGVSNHGLTFREACSMGYMVSVFYTGMGVSCGTDQYYRENQIEEYLTYKFKEVLDKDNIQLSAELFYEKIIRLYTEKIDDYAYHYERINLMISLDTKERFNRVKGRTLNEKLVYLLKEYYK